MQQGTKIPVTGKLYNNDTQVTDLSKYDFDALVICSSNNEQLLYSSRDVMKNGDITIINGQFGFLIEECDSARLLGKCYVELRAWLNDSSYIGLSKENKLYFNVEPNEIHHIC